LGDLGVVDLEVAACEGLLGINDLLDGDRTEGLVLEGLAAAAALASLLGACEEAARIVAALGAVAGLCVSTVCS
jgi:hypothetical protein